MDKQNIAEMNILQEIDSNGKCTQRELSVRSGLTLSYVNVYLQGLIRKGFVSVRDMPGRRLWYNLTPMGMAEKAKMTLEYMKWSLTKYQNIRNRVRVVCEKLKQENKLNIVICGVSDAAENFSLQPLKLVLKWWRLLTIHRLVRSGSISLSRRLARSEKRSTMILL